MRTAHESSRSGFTLVEVLVVVVIMALMATILIPRMLGNNRRELELASERVADLLLVFSLRNNFSEHPIGISQDEERNTMTLMHLVDPDGSGREADWERDPSVTPVTMPPDMTVDDVQVWVDGQRTRLNEWPLVVMPGEQRPLIEITLDRRGERITVSLAPHSVGPQIRGAGHEESVLRTPVDLDSIGRSREDW